MQKDFLIFFLISVRIVAMLVTSPVFSLRQIPVYIKVGLSLVISSLISAAISTQISLPSNWFSLSLYVGKELFIGVSIGYISTFIFNAVRVSAQLMDFHIGFSMSQYYDPSTAGNSTPLERFFNWFALVLFLVFNFHHIILSAVIKSFDVIPVGTYSANSNVFLATTDIFSNSFYLAIQLSAPIVIILFVTDFTMGLIARTVPQLNIFILGMPLKVLIGLLAVSAVLPGLTHIYIKSFESIYTNLLKFFNVFPFIMLMADDKTEEPTYKKLQDARKKGLVAKSIDLTSSVVLLGIAVILILFGSQYYTNGRLFIIDSFKYVNKSDLTSGNVFNILIYMIKNGLIAALPVILTVMLLEIIGNILQTGFLYTTEGLKPDLKKFNLIEGIKRFYSKRAFVELFKSLGKISVLSYISFRFVKDNLNEILKTSDLNPRGLYRFVKNIMDSQLIRLVIIMFIIGISDYIFQKRQYKKDLRMTKQEIREELKQSEGDPQIKSRIRQKQREMAMKRMMHEVPKATVVVTNPTHFAVALKYESGVDRAPRVVAKGMDLIALKIKEIAKGNDVPVVENKSLARTLYARVNIDEEVPVELYQAVAEIIAYVYSLKRA